MALEDKTLEELNDLNLDGAKVTALRSRTIGFLSGINTSFVNLEALKVKYSGDLVREPEIDALIAELKLAMFNIYQAH